MGGSTISVLAALALGVHPADRSAFDACRAESKSIGQCNWRDGRFISFNGQYSNRIATNAGWIAVEQSKQINPNEYAPTGVEKILERSPNLWAVEGNFLICPLKQPHEIDYLRENHLKIACLAGARRLSARRMP
ncbi:hypothetical protein [Sphingomonas sp. KR3-1]|uniref:hypothetical protein n=1 Tax=Sphingomonas sp. KR3-1 TaxID=3156611 RepID=UPI0032B4D895